MTCFKNENKSSGRHSGSNEITRRYFVKLTGITALGISSIGITSCGNRRISIVQVPGDPLAHSAVTGWAVEELVKNLETKGLKVTRLKELPAKPVEGDIYIVIGISDSVLARDLLMSANTSVPELPEAQGLIPVIHSGQQILLATGFDTRGLTYAVFELADRVINSDQPLEALHFSGPIVEKPANKIRGVNRLFVSEIEDKEWFYDKKMWPEYLTMLASQRFNRFTLSLGIGYDFLQNVTDAYFLFPYPFFLSVKGYNVKVPQLPDSERDNNLKMLRFISDETAARGMHFQLGLWMHGYEWLNSPNPNYTIEGLSPETQAQYSRDALRELLKECPSIKGITFRIHGESGVTEGRYNFWKTIFDGAATCGRKVEIDMHAKGMSPAMIETAQSTGLPVQISPKYWAEHLGLPYHQADIRALEIPRRNRRSEGLMNLSAGSRSFTRYGYADLLDEDRKYEVVHRIWPGTQRLLLWGDPLTSAAHSKAFSFCGSAGVDLMEPLSFKGRRGSGIAGGRCGYLDTTLKPRWDWQKYLYSYRVFGRLAYNPETSPDVWQRYLKKEFGQASDAVESALANATRILPVVLTVHGASAANNSYWPEMYTNMSIADPRYKNPYPDTPSPKIFGNVSPMDPQIFLSVNNCAKELLGPVRSGKYSPVEAAQWLEDYSDTASAYLEKAMSISNDREKPEFRRMAVDVSIISGLGRFFAAKFRAGVLFGIYQETGARSALEESLVYYRRAREHWVKLSEEASGVYKPDITIGENPEIKGSWSDRLPAIDDDIAIMERILEDASPGTGNMPDNLKEALQRATGRPDRAIISVKHSPHAGFKRGDPITLEILPEPNPSSVILYYRHVNHAERFETLTMKFTGSGFQATIPASYTDSGYPVQYYFEIREEPGKVVLFPGFNSSLDNQPYFVLQRI